MKWNSMRWSVFKRIVTMCQSGSVYSSHMTSLEVQILGSSDFFSGVQFVNIQNDSVHDAFSLITIHISIDLMSQHFFFINHGWKLESKVEFNIIFLKIMW